MGADKMEEENFTSLRSLTTVTERENVMMKLSVEEQELAAAYWEPAPTEVDTHWSELLHEDRTTSLSPYEGRVLGGSQVGESIRRIVGRRVMPEKWDASLSDLYSDKYRIRGIAHETLARPDVLINVVLGSGMGGVSQGAVRKHGKCHVITALVVDSDPVAEQTHSLSMPHIPTAC